MKRKKQTRSLAPVLLIVAGAGIFLYPILSNWYMQQQQEAAITSYEMDVAQRDDVEELWEQARTYNENLSGDPVHDPFVVGSGYVLPDDYGQVLNLTEDGIMGHVVIEKIKVDLPIYHGTGEDVLKKGIGHIEGSSLPIGGKNSFSILCAHRGLPSAELFTRLNELKLGDVFYVHVLDEKLAYEVDEIKVVEPQDLMQLQMIPGRDLITLMTCTPYGVNTQRLLVRGSRIPYEESIEKVEVKDPMVFPILLGSMGILGIVLLSAWYLRRRSRVKDNNDKIKRR